MTAPRYTYDPKKRRYRNAETGRYLSESRVLDLRDAFVAQQSVWAADLARMLVEKKIGLAQWEREVRGRIKKAYIAEYALGRGGTAQLGKSDYGRIGAMLKGQYGYLRGFAEDIMAGKLSHAEIENRAELYFESSRQAFERGSATAWGFDDLPYYPGDGSTACKSRCRCAWRYTETGSQVSATWATGSSAQTCADCAGRSGEQHRYTKD